MDISTKEQMLTRWREALKRDEEILAIWRENGFRFRTNGVDTTEQDMADWEGMIERQRSLIARVEASDA